MRWAYMLVVCGGVGVAILIVLFIPLNRQRIEAARQQLEAKRLERNGEPA